MDKSFHRKPKTQLDVTKNLDNCAVNAYKLGIVSDYHTLLQDPTETVIFSGDSKDWS